MAPKKQKDTSNYAKYTRLLGKKLDKIQNEYDRVKNEQNMFMADRESRRTDVETKKREELDDYVDRMWSEQKLEDEYGHLMPSSSSPSSSVKVKKHITLKEREKRIKDMNRREKKEKATMKMFDKNANRGEKTYIERKEQYQRYLNRYKKGKETEKENKLKTQQDKITKLSEKIIAVIPPENEDVKNVVFEMYNEYVNTINQTEEDINIQGITNTDITKAQEDINKIEKSFISKLNDIHDVFFKFNPSSNSSPQPTTTENFGETLNTAPVPQEDDSKTIKTVKSTYSVKSVRDLYDLPAEKLEQLKYNYPSIINLFIDEEIKKDPEQTLAFLEKPEVIKKLGINPKKKNEISKATVRSYVMPNWLNKKPVKVRLNHSI